MEIEVYKENPCGILSIPYWKNKYICIPGNMRIVHDTDYIEEDYRDYHDEPYFRLYHALVDIQTITLDDISIVTAKQEDISLLVDVINRIPICRLHLNNSMAIPKQRYFAQSYGFALLITQPLVW